jgi:acid phosphatase type 7
VPPTATAVAPTATSVAPSGPTTLTLAPAADAYVDADQGNTNYGTSEIVRTDSSPDQRAYLRFNVTGVSGRPVTRAVLRIYANGSSPVGFQLQKVPDNNWSETGITFNNRPMTSGQIAAAGAHSYGVWLTVDITGYITGDGSYSLALLSSDTKPVGYPSRESASNRPELVLTVGGS